jgi:hypothetical protein
MTPNAETGKIVKQFMKASRWIPPSLLGGSKAGSPKASFGCALLRHDMSKACAHSEEAAMPPMSRSTISSGFQVSEKNPCERDG